MRHSGKILEVGVEGRDKDGNLVMPTVWASCGTIKDGAVSGVPGAPNPETDIPSGGGVAIDDSVISSDSTWSSKNTVDKLCPSFTESGAVVTCEPLEGYPLEVRCDGTAHHLGANLIPQPYQRGTFTSNGITFTINDDYSITLDGTATGVVTFLFLGKGAGVNAQATADIGIVEGETYTMSLGTPTPSNVTLYVHLYTSAGEAKTTVCTNSATGSNTFTVGSGCELIYAYLRIANGMVLDNFTIYPMIQHGSVATEYEQYRKEVISGGTVAQYAGVNTFFAENGEVTVTGKKDPVALINKLEATVNALLGG